MNRRKIAVFTGNRAEYGLQFPILRALAAHPEIDHKLIVSGAHLDPNFGATRMEIERDGFSIDGEVQIDLATDTLYATARAIGTGTISMAEELDRIRPDLLVVYADRFEGFAAMIAGSQMGIPTAHIEGGDVTEGGALDDMVRHAMTKLAHLHFTTNEDAARRIRAMGEEDWRVFNVGFPSIDLITDGNFATADELAGQYGIDPAQPLVLFTQHSVTTQFEAAEAQLAPSLEAIEKLASEGVMCLLTYPNNDAGGRRIISTLEAFAARGLANVQLHKSLGRYNYHGVLNLCGRGGVGACVGNSSSGIKETPAFGCPTVDVGSRQAGRLSAENVVRADYDAAQVYDAISKCLYDADFRKRSADCDNPYGSGGTGMKVAKILSSIELSPDLIRKRTTI